MENHRQQIASSLDIQLQPGGTVLVVNLPPTTVDGVQHAQSAHIQTPTIGAVSGSSAAVIHSSYSNAYIEVSSVFFF